MTVNTEAFADWLLAEPNAETGEVAFTIALRNGKVKQVELLKVGSAADHGLEGASFRLYRAEDYDDANNRPVEGAEALAEGDTDADGLLSLGALPMGQYRLVETAAPEGYILLEVPVAITVRETGVTAMQGMTPSEVTSEDDGALWRIRVWNDSGVAMPETGGPGTAAFSACGAALIALALALLLKRISV